MSWWQGVLRAGMTGGLAMATLASGLSGQMDMGAGMTCSTGQGHGGAYFLKDFQYYKPMLADIREPSLYVRHYWNEESVRFAKRTSAGSSASTFDFFDVGYGRYFPFLGWNAGADAPENCLEANGLATFIQGSAHSLFDMDTQTHDLLNTDYRIGIGVAGRFARHFSVRLQAFHESTHIGDEYTLGAVENPEFRRYNVAYEAYEGYLAVDRYDAVLDEFPDHSLRPVYARAYMGGRHFVSFQDRQAGFDKEFAAFDFGTGLAAAEPLRVRSVWEGQVGGELFWDMVSLPDESDGSFLGRLISPQYFFTAGEIYLRDRYGVLAPERAPSLHVVAGFIYGPYFRGERTVRWAAHYYNGVNPHGQFRAEEISYVGVSFALLF